VQEFFGKRYRDLQVSPTGGCYMVQP
jgi:hypothetical protein